MRKTTNRMRLCTVLLVLNIAFIWGNSLLPGSVSGALSGWLKSVLAMLFPGGSDDPDAGHGLLRKLAHFTEFACLGGLLVWLCSMLRRPAVLSVLGGFLVACIDEGIQMFVPDRGPGILDVLLDTAGTLVGMSVVLLGYTVYIMRNKQVLEEKSS